MAITWEKKITVLDVKRGNVSVTLTRVDIDDTDPTDIKRKVLNTCSVLDAIINTPELKQQVTVELKRQYVAQKRKVIDDAAIVGTFNDDLDAAIANMEKP